MTDAKRVLLYILSHGSITTLQAFKDLGISRLSGRIYDLKLKGIPINGNMVKVERRDGSYTYVKQYFLSHEVAELLRKHGEVDV